MHWLIGIDEAGYGPNIGPFIMTAVTCCVPDEKKEINLWDQLSGVTARRSGRKKGCLLVDDSKAVYGAGKGLKDLEASAMAFLGRSSEGRLSELLEPLCDSSLSLLSAEPWYRGDTSIPIELDAEQMAQSSQALREVSAARAIQWGAIRSIVVCPAQFNALTASWKSKAGSMIYALHALIQQCRDAIPEGDSIRFYVDKHGGRNAYAALLQEGIPDGFVIAEQEGALMSLYRIHGIPSEVRISFQPRADAEHFCTAVASIVSKYLREVLMMELNRFWNEHIPELRPTAGYPVDALRFLEDIRPTMQNLDIEESTVWRDK